jgi:hypothetical protein
MNVDKATGWGVLGLCRGGIMTVPMRPLIGVVPRLVATGTGGFISSARLPEPGDRRVPSDCLSLSVLQ